jgi:hypothetical protein
VACQDEKCVKVTVTQDGVPVSPPEEKGCPIKRPPSSISANRPDKELEKVSSTPTITNPTPVKSNTNGSHTSPSRKSSRKPKPSAKLLADAAISNHTAALDNAVADDSEKPLVDTPIVMRTQAQPTNTSLLTLDSAIEVERKGGSETSVSKSKEIVA